MSFDARGREVKLAAELDLLRRSGRRRVFAHAELPIDSTESYRVAVDGISRTGRPVAAWKLGATTGVTRRTFSTDTIYFGALTDAEVWQVSASPAHRPPPVFRAEAEIALRLGIDLAPGDLAGDPEGMAGSGDAGALFDAWAPALEAPYSPIENLTEAGLTALIADRCAAGALFLGDTRLGIDHPAMAAELAIVAGDAVLAAARAGDALLMTPLAAALGFLDQAAAHGVALKRGQWVSTGGVTPCVDLPLDGRPIALRLNGETEFVLDLVLRAGAGA